MDLSYCKSKINEYNNQIKKYAKYVKELQAILYNITGGLDDEINAVNRKVDDLQEDLWKSVKYNSRFKTNTDELDSKKEPRVRAVADYNSAIDSIDAEIRRISNLQSNAQSSADYYTTQYNNEKRRIEEEKRKEKEKKEKEKQNKK